MDLLNQNMKKEMERCKEIARATGLKFQDNTLEYIISNRDMLELSPKIMIPTLYDYWVHDVSALGNKWTYDALPHNPYETVINTRPPISFYNQDNTDWFNVMIFYHVLGHIDFFQNNIFFRKTWDDDFTGQALADKRLLNSIRQELGDGQRWVDYVIEFSRAIDNLVGFYPELEDTDMQDAPGLFGSFSKKVDFYFGQFMRSLYNAGSIEMNLYYDEIDRLNRCFAKFGDKRGEEAFFEDSSLMGRFPEFQSSFRKWDIKERKSKPKDIFEYLWDNSEFLNKDGHQWIKDVMQVVRRTSLYFQPQIRTKIANEGWASLWHQRLFGLDDHLKTHEVDYAIVDSGVTSTPRMGLNPYAIGKHLFEFIEDMARKGKLSREYQLLKNIEARRGYDRDLGDARGKQGLFEARKYFNDERLLNFLSDEDFQDFVDKYRLFVVGVRPHEEKPDKAEVYIKSKNGKDYRDLLNKQMYHPPFVEISEEKSVNGELYLDHKYEGRSLVSKYIPSVLTGLDFFWGRRKGVALETTEYENIMPASYQEWQDNGYEIDSEKVRVLYVYEDRELIREVL